MSDSVLLILEHSTTILLAILLITSELIGWSKCIHNSITQYLYSLMKKEEE
jgi:hypothetical protein